ncbi:MAG: DsrE family protein [Anaerolineales bacterium]|nr:DsrE family protein [Anaerolineales bacterium]
MTKAAIVVLSNLENHNEMARVLNALETVKDFKDSGDQVELIFDGSGVVSAVNLADSDNKLNSLFQSVEDKVAGLCKFCARAFEVYDKAEKQNLPFLAEHRQHPSLRKRAADGYQVITF